MKKIVAAVVTNEDHYCLLRRSRYVDSDSGLWHCVTGFLDPGVDAKDQITLELFEELDASPDQFSLDIAGTIEIEDWHITIFRVVLFSRDVRINWEHDACEWVPGTKLGAYPTVWWLHELIAFTG